MPILKKAEKEKNFTMISNDILRSPDLSLAAKGLLCYMLSCSEDWKFSIKGLSEVLNTPEYSIKKYLTELEKKGYHKKEAIRENGKISEWKYYISESPIYDIAEPEEKKPNLYQQCADVISEEFYDQEVKEALVNYLGIRIKHGRLSAKSWRTIILELRNLAKDKEEALTIIANASTHEWMKFYPVSNYKSKNRFVDDIVQVVTDDEEGLLRQQYMDEFSCIPKCDRPSFEDWRQDHA